MAAKHTSTPTAADTASQSDAATSASAAASTRETDLDAAAQHTEEETGHEPDFDPLARMFGARAETPSSEDSEDEDDADKAPEGAAEDKDTSTAKEKSEDDEDGDEAAGAESAVDGDDDWTAKIKAMPEEAQPMLFGQRKAIHRLRNKATNLTEELEAERAEKEELAQKLTAKANAPIRVEPAADDPLSHLGSEAEVEAELAEARAALDWAEEHEDGWSGKVNGEDVEYTAKDVRVMRRNAEKTLQVHGPARKAWLKDCATSKQEVLTTYPEIPKSATFRDIAVATLNEAPGMMRAAKHERIAANHALVTLLEKGELSDPVVVGALKRLRLVPLGTKPATAGAVTPPKPTRAGNKPPVSLSSAATTPPTRVVNGSGGRRDLATIRKDMADGKATGADLMLAHWGSRAAA
jgi:hypothetical protein